MLMLMLCVLHLLSLLLSPSLGANPGKSKLGENFPQKQNPEKRFFKNPESRIENPDFCRITLTEGLIAIFSRVALLCVVCSSLHLSAFSSRPMLMALMDPSIHHLSSSSAGAGVRENEGSDTSWRRRSKAPPSRIRRSISMLSKQYRRHCRSGTCCTPERFASSSRSSSSSLSSPSSWRTAFALLSIGVSFPNELISSAVELGTVSGRHHFFRGGWSFPIRPTAVEALSITTFNVLAAVHRSVPVPPGQPNVDRRESERRDWWQPRAEGLARFMADELASSDVVLLQEWWFGQEFEEIIDYHTEGIFDRVSEQRPGAGGTLREDGMAVLVKKTGKLELLGSDKVQTGPQRIAQIVQCREKSRGGGGGGRPVLLGNTHLSFPGSPDPVANERRQAYEVQLVARALSRAGRRLSSSSDLFANGGGHMQIIGGDFNSNIRSLASTVLESPRHHFVNCMSAHAEQNLCSIGGQVNIGVTHRTHRGEDVSVDQIFARLMNDDGEVSKTSLRRLGGPTGTYVVDCRKRIMRIEGEAILSDHMPVTATLHWPSSERNKDDRFMYDWSTNLGMGHSGSSFEDGLSNTTLHPLQSPWDS